MATGDRFDKGLRESFTQARDQLNKRLDRLIKSGENPTGTALERFLTRDENGNWTKNLARLRDIGTPSQARRQLERMQNAMNRPTGSLNAIRETRARTKQAFRDWVNRQAPEKKGEAPPEISDERIEALGDAYGTMKSSIIDKLSYDVKLSVYRQMARDARAGRDINVNKIVFDALQRYADEAESPQMKGARTRLMNAMATGDEKGQEAAIKRFNTAYLRYSE